MNKQKTVIILGGGSGGLVVANKLKKKIGDKAEVVLIDKNKTHVYAPSFLYLMLGKRQAAKIQKPFSRLERKGIKFINEEIIKIDPAAKLVKTENQDRQYDYLIISLGAELAPQKIPGLAESGYNLYELREVERLRDNLENFSGGKVAIVISSLPFKCPAAPYETAFLLDEYFQKKGIRDKTELSIFTPEILPMPAAGSAVGKAIKAMVEGRSIKFNPEVQLVSVNSSTKRLTFDKNPEGKQASSGASRDESFDLLVYVPPHQGPKAIRDSHIGNEMGWVPVDKKTLKIRVPEHPEGEQVPYGAGSSVRDAAKYENVFAIGDIAAITLVSGKPLSKAGVFAHFEAEVVVENIISEIKGLPAKKEYDGRAYCFLETGFGKAGFASGNFYAEPAPVVKMKRPGRLWHWGKLLFEKYWMWKWF